MKRYELKADVYQYYYDGQDPETGQMLFHWDYDNPVVTKATGGNIKPFESLESFGAQYKNAQMIQLFMPYRPSLRDKVGRVRDKAGAVQFIETNGSPTTFEIQGVFPQVDMNGRTTDYRVICIRGTVQQ
ncbi:hypothetical protein [Streptomyces tendae]|uniref:hypothetical protein n=1 Tax=Streptomyces tendae TaxID=1932 RepID=UPI003D75F77F